VWFALSGLGGGLPFARAQLAVGDGEAEALTGRELVATLGAQPGQVHWAGSGGFATPQGETRVTLNEMEWLTWGSADFVPNGQALVFGRPDTAGTIDWNSRIDLGGSNKKQPRQIRLVRGRAGERAAVALRLRDAFRSTVYEQHKSNWRLDFLGDGRFDLLAAQPHLARGDIHVLRAELRIAEAGQLNRVRKFDVAEGACVVVDEREAELDRLGAKADLQLHSSTFRYLGGGPAQPDASEHLGRIFLAGGVSTIDVLNESNGRSSVFLKSLARAGASEALRGVFEVHTRGQFVLSSEQVNPDFEGYGGILPWATINAEDWVARSGKDWVQVNSHYTADESSWEPGHNVTVREPQHLSTERTINSLRAHGGSLNLGGHMLTVTSGGLITVGPDFTFGSSDASGDYYRPSVITTGKQRNPLYVHAHTDNVWMEATLTGGMDLVKAGPGALHLMHRYTGKLGDVYLHQGCLEFTAKSTGTLQTGALYVGDGARSAVLKLAGRERLSSRPQLTLRGSAHTPADAGVLELSGNTQQSFGRLHVENAAVIDFEDAAAGAVTTDANAGAQTLLCLDALTFNNESARLVVLHWERGADRLIVRRSANLSARAISQIDFEGWGNARLVDYDKEHWEIVSGPLADAPAPSHAQRIAAHPVLPERALLSGAGASTAEPYPAATSYETTTPYATAASYQKATGYEAATGYAPTPAYGAAAGLGATSAYGAEYPGVTTGYGSAYAGSTTDAEGSYTGGARPYVPPPAQGVVSHGLPSSTAPASSTSGYSEGYSSGGYSSSQTSGLYETATSASASARSVDEQIQRILYETAYRG